MFEVVPDISSTTRKIGKKNILVIYNANTIPPPAPNEEFKKARKMYEISN